MLIDRWLVETDMTHARSGTARTLQSDQSRGSFKRGMDTLVPALYSTVTPPINLTEKMDF